MGISAGGTIENVRHVYNSGVRCVIVRVCLVYDYIVFNVSQKLRGISS